MAVSTLGIDHTDSYVGVVQNPVRHSKKSKWKKIPRHLPHHKIIARQHFCNTKHKMTAMRKWTTMALQCSSGEKSNLRQYTKVPLAPATSLQLTIWGNLLVKALTVLSKTGLKKHFWILSPDNRKNNIGRPPILLNKASIIVLFAPIHPTPFTYG